MTATHLKRLFANQDVFNSLDRSVANLSVSEVDEKESKHAESDARVEPLDLPNLALPTIEPSRFEPDAETDGGVTPMAGVFGPQRNPLSHPPTPEEYDSDSTISAPRRDSPQRSPDPGANHLESSGMDSDQLGFVSRLPRRSRPAPR